MPEESDYLDDAIDALATRYLYLDEDLKRILYNLYRAKGLSHDAVKELLKEIQADNEKVDKKVGKRPLTAKEISLIERVRQCGNAELSIKCKEEKECKMDGATVPTCMRVHSYR
jgi:DNA-binding transcriptional MerR regulator